MEGALDQESEVLALSLHGQTILRKSVKPLGLQPFHLQNERLRCALLYRVLPALITFYYYFFTLYFY